MKKNDMPFFVVCILACAVLLTPKASSAGEIFLRLETATTTLFDGSVNVTACAPREDLATSTSAYCALNELGLNATWSPYGDDYFLQSVAGISNDYDNSIYWGWFSDLNYGTTSLYKHEIAPGEHMLITFGKMPLKLVLSTSSPVIGSTTTIFAYEFGFDDSWNGIWKPAGSSTIEIMGEKTVISDNAAYEFAPTSTDSIIVSITKAGFVEAQAVIAARSDAPDVVISENSGNSGYKEEKAVKSFDVSAAIGFISLNQKADGSFGSSIHTDWAAIACAVANHSCSMGARAFLVSSTDNLVSATDYERRAMSLLALGVNPYSGTSINIIKKITEFFDGNQIGEKGLVNDDIFALFPLLKSGYTANDGLIMREKSFILSKQKDNGSWENSIDLTAAAIQALDLLDSGDVGDSIQRAKEYLRSKQENSGGFGSSFSTAWVMQAIAALGERPQDWSVSGSDPLAFLASLQAVDGGIDLNLDTDTRVWSTSYAVPAVLGLSWGNLLNSFPREAILAENGSQNQDTSAATHVNQDSGGAETSTASTTAQPVLISIFATTTVPSIPKEYIRTTNPVVEADAPSENPSDTSKLPKIDLDNPSDALPAAVGVSLDGKGYKALIWSAIVLLMSLLVIVFIIKIKQKND